MKNRLFVCFSLIALSLGSSPVVAGESQLISVSVQKGEKIAIRIPASWRHKLLQPAPDLPPILKIATASDSLSLQITILTDTAGRFANRGSVDRAVTSANQHYVGGSVEKRLTLTQLVSTNGYGCYSAFTDAQYVNVPSPPKGEFRNVTSGLFAFEKFIANFTLLTNDPSSSEAKQALRIISDGISGP
jgi:hypothetical protein